MQIIENSDTRIVARERVNCVVNGGPTDPPTVSDPKRMAIWEAIVVNKKSGRVDVAHGDWRPSQQQWEFSRLKTEPMSSPDADGFRDYKLEYGRLDRSLQKCRDAGIPMEIKDGGKRVKFL